MNVVEAINKKLFWYPLKSNVIYGLEIAYPMLCARSRVCVSVFLLCSNQLKVTCFYKLNEKYVTAFSLKNGEKRIIIDHVFLRRNMVEASCFLFFH